MYSVHISSWPANLGGLGQSRRRRRMLVAELVFALAASNRLDERRVDVDQVLDAQTGIDEVLDLLHAKPIHVRADSVAMVGHLVDHLAACLAEPIIVLEEIAMAVNVGHDQLVVGQPLDVQQVRVAGIVVDDQFVDLLQSVRIAFGELLVLHPESPVGIPCGEAPVGGHGMQLVGVDQPRRPWERSPSP